ncbi:MAG: helix-turn-helix domain-containing protein, partial [Candidatus Acidiferrales bacterium]
LRERADDIATLAEHFAQQVAQQNGWKAKHFAPEAIAELQQYAWPGNVRELRNVVERLLLLANGDQIDASTVRLALPSGTGFQPVRAVANGPGQAREGQAPFASAQGGRGPAPTMNEGSLAERVEAFERQTILTELERQKHHMTNTAKALGLERSHLYKKCQQLGIDLKELKSRD